MKERIKKIAEMLLTKFESALEDNTVVNFDVIKTISSSLPFLCEVLIDEEDSEEEVTKIRGI